MNAFELYNEKGKPCGIWCCGKCRKLVLSPTWRQAEKSTQEEAERCCRPPVCDTCHKEFKPQYSNQVHECDECERSRLATERDARLFKRIESAEDVTGNYDGPVYVEGSNGGDMGEGYFSSIECVYDDEDGADGWAFACTSRIEKLDIDHCIENLCSDGYEDMQDRLMIPQSLKDAVDEFNRLNETALTVWEADYKRKVRIAAEE